MSEPIKVGDLVQVVRPSPCCGASEHIGKVFVVAWIDEAEGPCSWCGRDDLVKVIAGPEEYPDDGYSFGELKRIPPIEELDDVKRDEEITA